MTITDVLQTRRIVTGIDANGRSVFVQDGPSPRTVTTESLPGLALVEMWALDETPRIPVPHTDPVVTMSNFVPKAGGVRFRLVRFPGKNETAGAADARAFHEEYLRKAPGLADSMEEEDPAMHTTLTVDFGIVLSGKIILELDDGATVHLKQGDCVIQNGTRHAWRNPHDEACVMAFFMTGATGGKNGDQPNRE
jgi:mannose-6-phosphate isomerase-like protein (cupin superfamily)